MGTCDYMAPEQALNTKRADARADIYSLGCTLYYLLTGKVMYGGETLMEKMMAHQEQPIPPLPNAPRKLQAVYARMVAKKPEQRPPTMVEVIAELETSLPRVGTPAALAAWLQGSPPATPAAERGGATRGYEATGITLTRRASEGRRAKPSLTRRVSVGVVVAVLLLVPLAWLLWPKSASVPATRPASVPTPPPSAELVKTFTNALGMEFVLVPKGKAWLGGSADKPGDKEVDIKRDFYLGQYEVTQEEWQKVMGVNPSRFKTVAGVAKEDQKRFPVEMVSWEDAQTFIQRVNAQAKEAGWVYRLPTEVEWEYACRGGPMKNPGEGAFDYYLHQPTNRLLPEQANIKGSGLKRPCKVGSYPPNRLGLHDMHGNVYEWCDNTENAPGRTNQGVFHGGGWSRSFDQARAASRWVKSQSNREPDLGLRLARVSVGSGDRSNPTSVPSTEREKLFTNSLGMKMVLIPKGKFLMGGSGGTPGTKEVEIKHDFYLGQYEVTQWEWMQVMGNNPSYFKTPPPPKPLTKEEREKLTLGELQQLKEKEDRDKENYPKSHPVENVSWEDCQEFIQRLNDKEKASRVASARGASGWVYCLPSEAEWEYACRGSGDRPVQEYGFSYYFDQPTNMLLPEMANFHDSGKGRTCKVGSYKPNRLGLYDMHGNVWEWCSDEVPGDPKDPKAASQRVHRGGSYGFAPTLCHAANRIVHAPSFRNTNVGLRLARVPVGAK
jgi:formylglycine-generating enzyme required for sulfatase activity